MAEVIGPEGVPQGDAAGAPAGDGCVAAPVAAGASAFQVDASAERGAGESVGEYGAFTFLAVGSMSSRFAEVICYVFAFEETWHVLARVPI